MKGVVLAGGRGTRLKPLTLSVNKHLLPVYNQPLVYWPVMTLVRLGIGEITIVSNPEDVEHYRVLFGDGSALGVSITYAVQESADGIAGALAAAEGCVGAHSVAVILGDNVFMDTMEIRDALEKYRGGGERGAMVFLKEVPDPERFGVAEIRGDAVVSIVEKPTVPVSHLAVTGLYFYDASVFDSVRSITPSQRGELEITDVNTRYINNGAMTYTRLTSEWIDAGTHESLLQANLIAAGIDYDPHKKMKVLFGINKLAVGGAEHLVLHQIAHMNRGRFEPYLATMLPSTQPNLDAEAAYLGDHWQQCSFSSFFDIRSWWKLYRYLRQERFDVVVANLFFTGVVLRIAAVCARVPIILSTELNAYTGKSRRSAFLDRVLARFTDRFLVSSKEVLGVSTRELRQPSKKFTLNYNAIDLSARARIHTTEESTILRAQYAIAPRDIVIISAGRLVEQKGQQYLIDAIAVLVQQEGVPPIKVFIFGAGSLQETLTAHIRQQGLEKTIVLPGVAPISTIVGIADVFVLPSLWEGMSLMLLEAMAAGLPIIATDVSGSRELITDRENGFLVPIKDSNALAEKLRLLLCDPVLREKFGRASLKEVQKFSIENNLSNLYTVIHTVARSKRL